MVPPPPLEAGVEDWAGVVVEVLVVGCATGVVVFGAAAVVVALVVVDGSAAATDDAGAVPGRHWL